MVFQASEKKTNNKGVGADFKDLELVKQTEDKAIQDIERSKKQAELSIGKGQRKLSDFESKAIADLKAKLDQQFKFEEKAAISQATKIKAEGEGEASALKERVKPRIPQAVDIIVNAIISD